MPDKHQGETAFVSEKMFTVPIGDPIEVGGKIHRVADQLDDDWGEPYRTLMLSVTACGVETTRLRHSYPIEGSVCRRCWPRGICCPVKGPRPFQDRTAYFVKNPF